MSAIQRFLGHAEGLAFHEPVVIVYERELKALEQQAEHFERFKLYLATMGGIDVDHAWEATTRTEATPAARVPEARVDGLESALKEIVQWAKAYPLDIFPEPDFGKAAELLKAGGMTLDAISASNMRHVVEGVGKIAKEALAEEEA